MSHLTPCPSCGRHVRATEERCPFCQANFSETNSQDEEPIHFHLTNLQALTLAYGSPAIPGSARGPASFRDDPPAEPIDIRGMLPSYDSEAPRLPAPIEDDFRPAPKYGAPPLRRFVASVIFVGGVAIIVYLLVWR